MTRRRGQITPDVGGIAADVVATFTLILSIAGTAISMAVLVFSGSLEDGLPRAVGAFVVAGGLMNVWIAARSRIIPAATIVQDGPAIVAAAVVADFINRDQTEVVDVFVLLALTTLICGIVLWLLGRFNLGGLVRYMPTTVVGAFVAGTGWLLFKGGFDVMVGFGIGLVDLDELFSAQVMKFWVPGLVIGLAAWAIGRSDRFPAYAVGLTVLLCLGAFYVVAVARGSVAAVEEGGWLIGPFPDSTEISIVTPSEFRGASWSGAVASLPGIASVIGLSAVALLLNLTGIGNQIAPRLDIDAELRTAGVANVLAAPFGASPGFQAMGSTLLLDRLGASRRAVPVVAGAALVVLGVLGVGAIGYVPRIIPGALLVTVGVGLLEEWGRGLRRSANRVEQALSVGILLVIAWLGILPGIGVGLVAACAVFIVRYSRVDPVRRMSSGHEMRSRVDRTPSQLYALHRSAEGLRTFELQGYLFFGSVASLENRVRKVAVEHDPRAVIFDFKHVTGIDPSGWALVGGVVEELREDGIEVIVSGLTPSLNAALSAVLPALEEPVDLTLDGALERYEEMQLARTGPMAEQPILADVLSPPLRAEFERVTYLEGSVVMEQGSASDGLFIIDDGDLSVFQIDEDGVRQRLRRLGPLGIVGEIGVITGTARIAEIVAETEVIAMWLSSQRYFELRDEHPGLMFELHEFIMRAQAERVVSLTEGLTRSLR